MTGPRGASSWTPQCPVRAAIGAMKPTRGLQLDVLGFPGPRLAKESCHRSSLAVFWRFATLRAVILNRGGYAHKVLEIVKAGIESYPLRSPRNRWESPILISRPPSIPSWVQL